MLASRSNLRCRKPTWSISVIWQLIERKEPMCNEMCAMESPSRPTGERAQQVCHGRKFPPVRQKEQGRKPEGVGVIKADPLESKIESLKYSRPFCAEK
ncbi:unnamed protein product [Toxocara canis]|uniref:Uncharacterized protein n=1 Tax=Toxocara canis TaxID=6265 RepID=A0A183UKU1_TOXCA|nr:unnamed protein product [Toxocara canis]